MRIRAILGAALLWTLAACGDDDGSAIETVTQLIGPEGGTVELAGGGKVEIPAGALADETPITITKLNDSDALPDLPENLEPAGKPYAFKPHGLMFAMPVKVEVPYEGSELNVRPVKLPNETQDQEPSDWTTVAPSAKDTANNKVSGDVMTFSVIMAARPRRGSSVITLLDGAIDDGSVAGTGGTGGSGGTSGSSGSGGSSGTGGSGDSGLDAMVEMDAGMDATLEVDAGVDASTPFNLGYIKASNTGADDTFGNRIAIDGDTLVVGANAEDSNATGIDGDEANNSASYAGAAYVFVRSGGTWVQQAYLKASNAQANDMFGDSVAISGDTIVVGAPSEDSNATGVNGDQSDNSANFSGAAYVFVRNGSTWTQQAYLKASNSHASLNFGLSVAIGGDVIVVGATGDSSNATTINGNESDTSAPGAGAAYVFRRTGTTWAQEAYLKASNAEAQDDFGVSVAITDDGQDIVVGADREDSNATGVGGDDSNNSVSSAGAAYLFRYIGNWQQHVYLKPSNPTANGVFGYRVAIDGITVVVAAPGDDSNATGTNGDDNNTLADSSGAVFVFGNDEGSWRHVAYLKASNTGVGDEFGTSVAIAGDILVVGAQTERSNATGIDGDQLDNSASGAGAAYVFAGAPGGSYYPYSTWRQQAYLKASNTGQVDNFGTTVAVSSTAIAVGAPGEDSNATGVGGDSSNNSASGSGAVYAFDPIVPFFTEDCTDGFDDDGDGDPDCNDSECFGMPACL